MTKKSLRAGTAAVAGALFLFGGTAASATEIGTTGGWELVDTVVPTQQVTATTSTIPVVGDFSGDGRQDVLMYAPGTAADSLWISNPMDPEDGLTANRFTVTSQVIRGSYVPLAGDFDGNGSDDIFWYGPGTTADAIWYFDGGVVVSASTLRVNGVYKPVVGNFDTADSDSEAEKDDILWWGVNSSPWLWSGQANRTFQSRGFAEAASPNAQLLVGNFFPDSKYVDGGSHLDLFVYVPGTGADFFWKGNGTGAFTKSTKSVNGTYIPVVGDFDHRSGPDAGLTDILWYAPGNAGDFVWMNQGATSPGTFSSTSLAVNGTYQPFVIPGLFGQDSIMWRNLTGADWLWTTNGVEGCFSATSVNAPGADMGARTPLVGMWDDAPLDLENPPAGPWGPDILWFSLGNGSAQTEVYWQGNDSNVPDVSTV